MARNLEEQTNSLAAYLPTGRAWAAKNIEGTVMRGLLVGLSGELLRNAALIEEFREEILPDKTVLFLDEWERAVSIPDDCFTGSGSDEERRNDILAKLASLGVQTAEDMRVLALLVYGVELTIKNPTRDPDNNFPYTFHPTGEADPGGDGGAFTFNLSDREARFQIIIDYDNLPEPLVFPLTFPIPFLTREIATVECLFTKLRPANVGFTKEILVPTTSEVPPPDVVPVQPVSGISLFFDGPTGPLLGSSLSDGPTFDPGIPNASTNELTVSMWVKGEVGIIGNGQVVVGIGDGGGPQNRVWMHHHLASNEFSVIIYAGATLQAKNYNANVALPTIGDWAMLTVTWDGTNDVDAMKLYVEATLDAAPTKDGDQDITGMVKGNLRMNLSSNGNFGGGSNYDGHIYSVASWDKVLTAAEITAIYAGKDPDHAVNGIDLLVNKGDYVSAANLQSWHLPGRNASPELGFDFGPIGAHLVNEDDVDDDDRVGDVPTP